MKPKLITLLFLIISIKSFSQWLDPQSIQATVLIEKIENQNFITHGTGILIYNYENPSEGIVVTCAHLVKNKKELSVRVKPDSTFLEIFKTSGQNNVFFDNALVIGNTIRLIADLSKENIIINEELDIAAFRLKKPPVFQRADTSGTQISLSKLRWIPESRIDYKKDLSLGDEVYFIGFPLGYGATESVEPIVRSGSIAWLPEKESFFLLDAFSYGGNSGSPIFRKTLISAIPGDLNWTQIKFIGMVVGHKSIKMENILHQPNPDELKFEKSDIDLNIGLAKCVYTDDIMKIVNELTNKKKKD